MGTAGNIGFRSVRITLALPSNASSSVEAALTQRGHHVQPSERTEGADLIIADADIAARTRLIERVARDTPGVEFVLVGASAAAPHPDVFAHVDKLDLARLLPVVDEITDILEGQRVREPVDLVRYETVFAGDSTQVRELMRRVRLVARSEAPVWLFGDDGSGRGIVARAIHDRSQRRTQPFVAYNAAAYSDEDLCRLLFHGDAAAIQQARTGSVFLDRVDAAGPHTQRELVQYLEARHMDPTTPRLLVGIQRHHGVDAAQKFIAPELFYRLKVLEVDIAALADRVRDLEHIVDQMLQRLAPGHVPDVSDEAMTLLESYSFPGNLLELAHALVHAFVLSRGSTIEPSHLPVSVRQAAGAARVARPAIGDLEELEVVIKRFERDYLLRVLRSVGGNRGRAAEILGLSRKGLWGKLKSHGISDVDIDQSELG